MYSDYKILKLAKEIGEKSTSYPILWEAIQTILESTVNADCDQHDDLRKYQTIKTNIDRLMDNILTDILERL